MAALLAVCLAVGSAPGAVRVPSAQAGPLRQVYASGVSALIPRNWDVRPLASLAAPRIGLRAFLGPEQREPRPGPQLGLEAYWIDATKISVPSDYYYLAARGTALRPLALYACRELNRDVLADHRPVFDRRRASPGDFVALTTGTCRTGASLTRWASFVAAPGFGPVRSLGSPQSGLYYALVVVPNGPRADERVRHLLLQVSFGGSPVSEFIRVARLGHLD